MKRKRAIVIDDDKLVLFIHKIMIEDCRPVWDTDYFPDGQSALNYINAQASAEINFLIFLDISMPGLSGWEILDELEKNPFYDQIFVVLVTAFNSVEDKTKSAKYKQVKAHLAKPFKTNDFNSLKAIDELAQFFENDIINKDVDLKT
ncbi:MULTISPECIES: response regulator [unclassified Pedobacter]|uniref:response regulator n=1 Tax=unclassified Pedobacter TaxID=2628915 RepID=UPI001E3EC1B3|nr:MULTISPECIES: response regulator [unclassified Pedobacter]